jgi:hypothetical protein
VYLAAKSQDRAVRFSVGIIAARVCAALRNSEAARAKLRAVLAEAWLSVHERAGRISNINYRRWSPEPEEGSDRSRRAVRADHLRVIAARTTRRRSWYRAGRCWTGARCGCR